jgi:hypothetical protein
MRLQCDYSGRNFLQCGLIWMDDSHVDSVKPSSERDLMIDRTLSMSRIRKFLKLWAFGAD